MPEEGPSLTKRCRICDSEMPKSAVFCTTCDHFNDWRRHFTISTPILALLVGLFSVLGMSLTQLLDFLEPPQERLVVSLDWSDAGVIANVTNVGSGDVFFDGVECSVQMDQHSYVGDFVNAQIRFSDFSNNIRFAPAAPEPMPIGARKEVPVITNSKLLQLFDEAFERRLMDPAYELDMNGKVQYNYVTAWECEGLGFSAAGRIPIDFWSDGLVLLFLVEKTFDGRTLKPPILMGKFLRGESVQECLNNITRDLSEIKVGFSSAC